MSMSAKDIACEAADAIAFGYPIDAPAREEIAAWLRAKGDTDPYAQRVSHLLMIQAKEDW